MGPSAFSMEAVKRAGTGGGSAFYDIPGSLAREGVVAGESCVPRGASGSESLGKSINAAQEKCGARPV